MKLKQYSKYTFDREFDSEDIVCEFADINGTSGNQHNWAFAMAKRRLMEN